MPVIIIIKNKDKIKESNQKHKEKTKEYKKQNYLKHKEKIQKIII